MSNTMTYVTKIQKKHYYYCLNYPFRSIPEGLQGIIGTLLDEKILY